jgi:hypothetical protein
MSQHGDAPKFLRNVNLRHISVESATMDTDGGRGKPAGGSSEAASPADPSATAAQQEKVRQHTCLSGVQGLASCHAVCFWLGGVPVGGSNCAPVCQCYMCSHAVYSVTVCCACTTWMHYTVYYVWSQRTTKANVHVSEANEA